MVQFEIALKHVLTVLEENPKLKTGVINMIAPDGTQSAPKGYGDGVVSVPWVLLDRRCRRRLVRQLLGPRRAGLDGPHRSESHATGTKTGDVIHVFQSGAIQMITDVGMDPAGNVAAANKRNQALMRRSPTPARTDFDQGRRPGRCRHLRRRSPGENAARRDGPQTVAASRRSGRAHPGRTRS